MSTRRETLIQKINKYVCSNGILLNTANGTFFFSINRCRQIADLYAYRSLQTTIYHPVRKEVLGKKMAMPIPNNDV